MEAPMSARLRRSTQQFLAVLVLGGGTLFLRDNLTGSAMAHTWIWYITYTVLTIWLFTTIWRYIFYFHWSGPAFLVDHSLREVSAAPRGIFILRPEYRNYFSGDGRQFWSVRPKLSLEIIDQHGYPVVLNIHFKDEQPTVEGAQELYNLIRLIEQRDGIDANARQEFVERLLCQTKHFTGQIA